MTSIRITQRCTHFTKLLPKLDGGYHISLSHMTLNKNQYNVGSKLQLHAHPTPRVMRQISTSSAFKVEGRSADGSLGEGFQYTMDIGDGMKAVYKQCPPEKIDQVVEMFLAAADRGDVGVDEFKDKEHIKHFVQTSYVYCTFVLGSQDIAAFFLHYDSPLSRSQKPIYSAGYLIVNPEYRSQGIAEICLSLLPDVTMPYGYQGKCGRASVASKSVGPLSKVNSYNVGVIPCSYRHPAHGLVDDLITYRTYTNFNVDKSEYNRPIPPLRVTDPLPEWMLNKIHFNPRVVEGINAVMRPGAPADVWNLEELIRTQAEKGEGFALDEFTDDGRFNRKLFRKFHLAVLEKASGDWLGLVMFGQSRLVRSQSAPTSHLYILIPESAQGQGIGKHLTMAALELLKELGYQRVISDVFQTNHAALQLVRELGFSITGSLPHCAYVAGKGYCNSIVIHRELIEPDTASNTDTV